MVLPVSCGEQQGMDIAGGLEDGMPWGCLAIEQSRGNTEQDTCWPSVKYLLLD